LRAASSYAGLQVNNAGALYLIGDGTLNAYGGANGAGIGGGAVSSGNCAIQIFISDRVKIGTAQGGQYGAGIGAGAQNGSGTYSVKVTISGETQITTAQGGQWASGIGAARNTGGNYSCEVSISGSTIITR
jgi:hypothetical protein